MADLLPKKYTLVRAADNKLYAVAKDETIPIDGNPNIPSTVVQEVNNSLDDAEDGVGTALAPYLQPHGSGVRVRVRGILD
ncbi:MAG TPA: hypothetical protein VFX07_03735 [Candidatus Udaeobacter sp.]|jgi:hypothetical protein|nr:hypothetical protein [Candidatus Udaeobacter sp.]